ncbi:unnamed protein product [Thlaspi arvense]|uniref:FBD domain-containing protein n=1 Tax=Thlaspi arvense TaxID=13288 RepID=A0AAU9SRZ2_THLAR|nr:unnamed protein product [Thlaspi arvense]
MEESIINDLPDDLMLKIFSLLPMFKDSVASRLISKRWKDGWKLVPDVIFDDRDKSCGSLLAFMSFVYGSLLINKPRVLERLHLKLSRKHSASDIDFLVNIAVDRSVRKLRIQRFGETLELPSCLSTCITLRSLILHEVRIKVVPTCLLLLSLKSLHLLSVQFSGDRSFASLLGSCPSLEYLIINQTQVDSAKMLEVIAPWFRLPSLKSLHLLSVKFSGYVSVASLLQSCPVLENLVVKQTKCCNVMFRVAPYRIFLSSLRRLHLFSVKFFSGESAECLLRNCKALEDLVIHRTKDDNVKIFNIKVPTLKSLSIENSRRKHAYVQESHGFVINAPALEKLNFKDTFSNFLIFEYMHEVTKANIEVICDQSEKFIGSLTSVQHLSLCCLTSETPYPKGRFFFFLEHLELCTCSAGWANLLACLLDDFPRLQSLKLKSQHSARYNDPTTNLWNEPTVVPKCLSTHLEILEWRQYEGTEQEKNVAAYILANAPCLKMATFSTRCRNKYHRMLRKLKKLKRVSETCQLVFE